MAGTDIDWDATLDYVRALVRPLVHPRHYEDTVGAVMLRLWERQALCRGRWETWVWWEVRATVRQTRRARRRMRRADRHGVPVEGAVVQPEPRPRVSPRTRQLVLDLIEHDGIQGLARSKGLRSRQGVRARVQEALKDLQG